MPPRLGRGLPHTTRRPTLATIPTNGYRGAPPSGEGAAAHHLWSTLPPYQQAAMGLPPKPGRGLPYATPPPRLPYQQAAIGVPCRLGRGQPHTCCDVPRQQYQQAAIGMPPGLGRGLPNPLRITTTTGRPYTPPRGLRFPPALLGAGQGLWITSTGPRCGPAPTDTPANPLRETPPWVAGCPVPRPLARSATPRGQDGPRPAPLQLPRGGRRGMGRTTSRASRSPGCVLAQASPWFQPHTAVRSCTPGRPWGKHMHAHIHTPSHTHTHTHTHALSLSLSLSLSN